MDRAKVRVDRAVKEVGAIPALVRRVAQGEVRVAEKVAGVIESSEVMDKTSLISLRRGLGDLRAGKSDDMFAAGITICRICGHIEFSFLELESDESNIDNDQECASCGSVNCEWEDGQCTGIVDRADARQIILDMIKENRKGEL